MDRVWDTSYYAPEPFVTLCWVKVIQGHEVKKFKVKILRLGGAIRVFRLDFRQERKK